MTLFNLVLLNGEFLHRTDDGIDHDVPENELHHRIGGNLADRANNRREQPIRDEANSDAGRTDSQRIESEFERTGRERCRHLRRQQCQRRNIHQLGIFDLGAGFVGAVAGFLEILGQRFQRPVFFGITTGAEQAVEGIDHLGVAVARRIRLDRSRLRRLDIPDDLFQLGGGGAPVLAELPHLVFVALGPFHARKDFEVL
ncbi:hypothetical protein [Nocardia ignorata]|uniref:hypothetical protein n=1 Tax=Nocardia ignorata TaxID=145285 RepID=UPI00105C82B6|nr:hypothetical protein [Nocardia ignorata]